MILDLVAQLCSSAVLHAKNEQSVHVNSTGRCANVSYPTPRIAHDPGLSLAGTRRTNQDVTANGTGNFGNDANQWHGIDIERTPGMDPSLLMSTLGYTLKLMHETLSESILRCVRAVFKKKKKKRAHMQSTSEQKISSRPVCVYLVSLLTLHAHQRDTHHHQYGLYTKTFCQLPTLTQFKLCCIGVLTFRSLGTGSNPHPVTDPFYKQHSRYCEICLLLVPARQVTTSLSRRATLWELHAIQWTPALRGSTLRCSVAATSAPNSPKVTSHPAVRLGVQNVGTHPRTGYSLQTGTAASPHSQTVSICAAGLSSHKS